MEQQQRTICASNVVTLVLVVTKNFLQNYIHSIDLIMIMGRLPTKLFVILSGREVKGTKFGNGFSSSKMVVSQMLKLLLDWNRSVFINYGKQLCCLGS